MRRLALSAALAFVTAAPAWAADPVEGEWLIEDGTAKVRIAPCPGRTDRLCGNVSWFKDPANNKGKDAKNPDPALRGRPLLGLQMITDFKMVSPGRWTGGKIYAPGEGRTYDSKMRINPNGTLKLEGCVLVICQAQTWRRG